MSREIPDSGSIMEITGMTISELLPSCREYRKRYEAALLLRKSVRTHSFATVPLPIIGRIRWSEFPALEKPI